MLVIISELEDSKRISIEISHDDLGHPSRRYCGAPPDTFDGEYPVGKTVCARCGKPLAHLVVLDGTRRFCTDHRWRANELDYLARKERS